MDMTEDKGAAPARKPLAVGDGFSLRRIARMGDPFIWMAGAATACVLGMIIFMLALVLFEGAGHFWPRDIIKVTLKDGTVYEGVRRAAETHVERAEGGAPVETPRIQLQVANRDMGGPDFVWIDMPQVERLEHPEHALYVERREWGPFIGALDWLEVDGARLEGPAALRRLRASAGGEGRVGLRTAQGEAKELPLAQVVRAHAPNTLGPLAKSLVFAARVREFVMDSPRESNTEGGVFPAIFGTVMMSLIMCVLVVPLGVMAALYLREYAKQGWAVSVVRIAVNNLAGVPSIVFGVFGLGFFVYGLGGGIDALFFSKSLPAPTFGTGGILWASLTLALLTVPVVIVSTEEALAFVPKGIRDGSLACGASKWQTLWHVVLPAAAPGILTGVILALARGAGEVAPLMITGVVKMAPDMPFDLSWPFIHLDRKFMHLGFHIYDVGFQSPNVEAAMPMVYTTTLLLILVIVGLNLGAMMVRNRLRKKYRANTF